MEKTSNINQESLDSNSKLKHDIKFNFIDKMKKTVFISNLSGCFNENITYNF